MKINYGLINTDSLPELQHWGMSPLGTQHLLHHHNPPHHPKAPTLARVGMFQVLPGSAGESAGNWAGLGGTGLVLGDVWGHHSEEVKGGMKFKVGFGMGCDSE